MIDFLDEHGVVLAINVDEDADTDAEPVDSGRGARPRRAVQHRDQVAQFTWVDPNTEAMLGYAADDLLGRSALEFVHPDDHDRGIDGWLAMLSGEPDTRHRLRWMTADGGWRWLELTHTNRLEDLGHVETEMLDVDDGLSRQRDTSLGGLLEPREEVEQGGLPATGRTHDNEELPARHNQVESLKGHNIAKGHGDLLGGQDRRAVAHARSSARCR